MAGSALGGGRAGGAEAWKRGGGGRRVRGGRAWEAGVRGVQRGPGPGPTEPSRLLLSARPSPARRPCSTPPRTTILPIRHHAPQCALAWPPAGAPRGQPRSRRGGALPPIPCRTSGSAAARTRARAPGQSRARRGGTYGAPSGAWRGTGEATGSGTTGSGRGMAALESSAARTHARAARPPRGPPPAPEPQSTLLAHHSSAKLRLQPGHGQRNLSHTGGPQSAIVPLSPSLPLAQASGAGGGVWTVSSVRGVRRWGTGAGGGGGRAGFEGSRLARPAPPTRWNGGLLAALGPGRRGKRSRGEGGACAARLVAQATKGCLTGPHARARAPRPPPP